MRLLDRYLLCELLAPLAFCLGGFTVFWMAFDLFDKLNSLQEHKLHGGEVVAYELLRTPELLGVVLPVALLLALLYALTQHARHNEVIAMRAAGVGLWRLAAPYLAVGVMASVFLFLTGELLAPRGAKEAERILTRHTGGKNPANGVIRQFAFRNARENRLWAMNSYNPATREMRNVSVDWQRADGSRLVFSAVSGGFGEGGWRFTNVQEHTIFPGRMFPENRIFTNAMSKPEFTETPAQIQADININLIIEKAHVELTQIPLAALLEYQKQHPELPGKKKCWLRTQIQSRFATPWTCLVVVVVAIPFGAAASGRRNVFVGVAGSIFICFTYFVLSQVGLTLGTGGYVPAWLGAWLPNLFFLTTGVALASRVR